MKRDKLFRLSLAILFLWTSLALAAPAAMAASSTALPGSSLWEPYLQQSRIDLEKAASSPWETLKSFLPRSFGALVRQTASRYTSVLLFLTLTAVLGLLAGECTDGALLDLVAAGGCGVLLWGSLLEEAQKLCEQMESWRSFLLGFLPVYAGVLTMGGEGAAGSAASGALLTALCFLAQLAAAFVQPLLHCYLMLSMACCVSSEPALGIFCKGVGSALRQALGWAGRGLRHSSWTAFHSVPASFWRGAFPSSGRLSAMHRNPSSRGYSSSRAGWGWQLCRCWVRSSCRSIWD